jgi:hypothetical protein
LTALTIFGCEESFDHTARPITIVFGGKISVASMPVLMTPIGSELV